MSLYEESEVTRANCTAQLTAGCASGGCGARASRCRCQNASQPLSRNSQDDWINPPPDALFHHIPEGSLTKLTRMVSANGPKPRF
jgi:hypothetical protein